MEVLNNKDIVFGQKLDSSAIAFGAALLMNAFLNQSNETAAAANENKVEPPPAPESTNGETVAEETEMKDETNAGDGAASASAAAVGDNEIKSVVSEFASLNTLENNSVAGLSAGELMAFSQQENEMYQADEVLALVRAKKNEIESFVLTMRSAPHQKHGGSINVSELEKILDEADNWSYSDEV
jgi:hypothetical protein